MKPNSQNLLALNTKVLLRLEQIKISYRSRKVISSRYFTIIILAK
jgi:hypothetical protein